MLSRERPLPPLSFYSKHHKVPSVLLDKPRHKERGVESINGRPDSIQLGRGGGGGGVERVERAEDGRHT